MHVPRSRTAHIVTFSVLSWLIDSRLYASFLKVFLQSPDKVHFSQKWRKEGEPHANVCFTGWSIWEGGKIRAVKQGRGRGVTEIKDAALGLGSGGCKPRKESLEVEETYVQKRVISIDSVMVLGTCSSNFKLSLTRTMNRESWHFEKLWRTCRECQLTKAGKGILGATEQEQVWRAGRCASSVLRELAGEFIDSSN